MSQSLQWSCWGKCGVMFSEDQYRMNKKWCDKCRRKKTARRKKTKYSSQESLILYALKQQQCNTGMLTAYANTGNPRYTTVIIFKLRAKHNITLRNGFYYYEGEK